MAKRISLEPLADRAGHLGHKIPVFNGENILLTLGHHQVGQGVADRVGDVTQRDIALTVVRAKPEIGIRRTVSIERLVPLETGWRFLRGRHALDRFILLECNFADCHVRVLFGLGCCLKL